MKKIKPIILLFLLAVCTGACTKGSNTPKPATGKSAVVTVTSFSFDGAAPTAFNSTIAGIVKVGNLITISSIQDGTTNGISLVLTNVTATGTYPLDKDNAQGNGAIITKDHSKPTDTNLNYSTDNTSGNLTGRGSVVITKLTDTEAEGTFNISAYNASGKNATASQGAFHGAINK